MTGIIALAGAFTGIIAGLYWKRATVLGGYLAMSGGLGGAIAFFLLHWPANYAGFGAFALAAFGMIAGSFLSPSSRNENSRELEPAG